MANITQDLVRELFNYQDGFLYWKTKPSKFSNVKLDKPSGSLNSNGYLQTAVYRKIYKTHRLIYLYHHGHLPALIDHINGNKTDNRIENLREATKSQNAINSKKRTTNSSGCRHVNWNKHNKLWYVSLMVDGKVMRFGSYVDFELAALVAQEARDKYHKEFARHE